MVAVRARERLLLHLLGNAKKFRENSEVPLELCQQGISKNIDVSRARVVQLLQSLKDDGMVKEEKKHVKGLKRKRKVYTLNEKGYKKASDLKDRYDEKEVTLKDEKGSEKIQLKNIDEYIDDKNPMIKALNLIEENDVIDLTKEWKEEEPEEIFVGRKEEIKALKRFIKKTKKSGSQMVFVEGEAGIGKTRLVSEVKSFASKEGFDFLSGKSINESAAPYLPFKEAFQQYRNKNKSEERNGSWGGLAFMGRGSEEEEENVDIFESEKEATFHDSAQYLKKIASESPLMIFLDDLHWADKATINLLSYLREKLKDVPVLFVGAYRPEEVGSDHQLKDLIHILKQKRMLEKIELKALKRDSTEEIIKRLLGKKEIPEDFIDLVLDKTEGNPLFVKETLELMKEEKMVDPKNDEFPTKKEDIPIPDLVEQVIERKIGRLGNETGRILQMGSVIGNRVSFQLLTSVTEMEEIALLDHIDALVSNNIWYEDPKEDVFHFSHGLVRDIIYNDLTKPKRRIFHKKVADDLKEIEKGPIEEIYSELAYHYAEAREYEEAVRYTKKAGEQAMDIYAYEDSIDLFQKVVDLVKKGPLELEDEKKTALELLGDLFRLTEEYDKSLERLEEVYQDPAEEQKERLHRKMAYVHLEKGDLEEAMDHVNTGLEEVEETSKEYCRLLELKGWIFAEKEDYERARELYEEEKRIGGMYGYEEVFGEALHELGSLAIPFSEENNPIDYLLKNIKSSQEMAMKSQMRVPKVLIELREDMDEKEILERALRIHERSRAIKRDVNGSEDSEMPFYKTGVIYKTSQNLLDQALDYYGKSLYFWNQLGEPSEVSLIYYHMGVIHQKKGDAEKAIRCYETSVENIVKAVKKQEELQAPTPEEASATDSDHRERLFRFSLDIEDAYPHASLVLERLGEIHRETGDVEKAVDYHDEALRIARDEERKISFKLQKALDLIEQKNPDKALELATDTYWRAKRENKKEWIIKSRWVMGKAHMALKDFSKARDELKEALGEVKKIEDEVAEAKVLYHLALLKRKVGEGDLLEKKEKKDEGEKFLQRTLQVFSDKKMKLWEERCEELMS